MESAGRVCINVTADRPASEPFAVSLIPMGMLSYQSASGGSVFKICKSFLSFYKSYIPYKFFKVKA